jgi:hypothetical protein
MGALFFYLQSLKIEEASVVAPLFQAAPLFGYAFSYGVLGERLMFSQALGGFMIIGGITLLSIRRDKSRLKMKLRLVALMLTCAFSMSLASLTFKICAVADEFCTATFWSFVGQAGFGAPLMAPATPASDLGTSSVGRRTGVGN